MPRRLPERLFDRLRSGPSSLAALSGSVRSKRLASPEVPRRVRGVLVGFRVADAAHRAESERPAAALRRALAGIRAGRGEEPGPTVRAEPVRQANRPGLAS